MKKFFAFFMLMAMVLFVSGCSGNTVLTKDNYENYLDVSLMFYPGNGSSIGDAFEFESAGIKCDITPASEALIYNDVTITFSIHGYIVYTREDRHGYEKTEYVEFPAQEITARCNAGGKWSLNTTYPLDEPIRKGEIWGYSYSDTIQLAYDVVSITGTVSKVG